MRSGGCCGKRDRRIRIRFKSELSCPVKPEVAFVRTHNACRSQIAEALGGKLVPDVVVSAGGEVRCPNVPSEYPED